MVTASEPKYNNLALSSEVVNFVGNSFCLEASIGRQVCRFGYCRYQPDRRRDTFLLRR